MTRPEIVTAWNEHLRRSFPGDLAGADIAGVCLMSADTLLAGCVSYFVESGTLDPERLGVVRSVCADLERVLPRLSGQGRQYFGELLKLGRAVEAYSSH